MEIISAAAALAVLVLLLLIIVERARHGRPNAAPPTDPEPKSEPDDPRERAMRRVLRYWRRRLLYDSRDK